MSRNALFIVVILALVTMAACRQESSPLGRKLMEGDSDFDQAQQDAAAKIRDVKRRAPRYDTKFHRAPKGFCSPDISTGADGAEVRDCDWSRYSEVLIMFGFPGMVMAGFVLVIFLLYIIGRYYFKCCGGKNASPGCLFPGAVDEFEGYARKWVIVARIFLFTIFAMTLIFTIFGWVNNTRISDAVSDFKSSFPGHARNVVVNMDGVRDSLIALAGASENATITEGMEAAIDAAAEQQDEVFRIRDRVDRYETWREVVLQVSFVFYLVISLAALLGALLNFYKLSYAMGLMAFFALFVLWASFAVHFPTSFLVADYCDEADRWIASNETSASNTTLAAMFKCDDADIINGLTAAHILAFDFRLEALKSGCEVYLNEPGLGGTYSVSCCDGSTPELTPCDINGQPTGGSASCNPMCYTGLAQTHPTYQLILQQPLPSSAGNDSGIHIGNCPETCTNVTLRAITLDISFQFNHAINYDNLIQSSIDPLVSCNELRLAVVETRDTTCVEFLMGIDLVTTAQLGLGIIFFLALPVMIGGYKRFNRAYHKSHFLELRAFSQSPL